jgi:hypothetical protein
MMITLFIHCLYQWSGIIIILIIGILIYHVSISCQHQAQAEGIFSEEMEQREADSSSLWSRVDVFWATTIALRWAWTWMSIISNKMVVMSCSNFHLWVSLAPRPCTISCLGLRGRFLGFFGARDSHFATISWPFRHFHGENDHQPFIKSRFWGFPVDFQEPNPFPSLSLFRKMGSQISWCPIVACPAWTYMHLFCYIYMDICRYFQIHKHVCTSIISVYVYIHIYLFTYSFIYWLFCVLLLFLLLYFLFDLYMYIDILIGSFAFRSALYIYHLEIRGHIAVGQIFMLPACKKMEVS